MVNTINQSFSEVYDIIMHLEKDLYNKIPNGFMQMIKQNRDLNYVVNLDYSKDINDQELLRETRVILSLIYRDYLCSDEKRKTIIEKDKVELKQYEEEIKRKYDIEKIFDKKRSEEDRVEHQQIPKADLPIEVKEKTFFKKIINKILSILKKH